MPGDHRELGHPSSAARNSFQLRQVLVNLMISAIDAMKVQKARDNHQVGVLRSLKSASMGDF